MRPLYTSIPFPFTPDKLYNQPAMTVKPQRLDLYHTEIPMKAFDHASATRETAEAIVSAVRYSDGVTSWGETLPRDYVTGETYETVPDDVSALWEKCCREGTLDVSDTVREVPAVLNGRNVNAAAAVLDIAGMRRYMTLANGRLSGKGMNISGSISSRVSGVIGSRDPDKNSRRLRFMRWAGLKDFKLKVGFDDRTDTENLKMAHKQLYKGIKNGRYSLRVDANGGWDADSIVEKSKWLEDHGVCAVEQPVYCSPEELGQLAIKCTLPLIADESLLNLDDAQTLVRTAGEKVWWNVRISKNGGLLPALRLLRLARDNGITTVLGCMVGESAILSAAQRRLLQAAPPPRFVEGNYGRLLLSDDLSKKSPRFGFGGKLKPLKNGILGIEVDGGKVRKYGRQLLTRGG